MGAAGPEMPAYIKDYATTVEKDETSPHIKVRFVDNPLKSART